MPNEQLVLDLANALETLLDAEREHAACLVEIAVYQSKSTHGVLTKQAVLEARAHYDAALAAVLARMEPDSGRL